MSIRINTEVYMTGRSTLEIARLLDWVQDNLTDGDCDWDDAHFGELSAGEGEYINVVIYADGYRDAGKVLRKFGGTGKVLA
jgi:hypothetical protein